MHPIWLQSRPVTVMFWITFAVCLAPELIGSFWQNSGAGDQRRDRGSKALIVIGINVSLILAFNLSARVTAAAISSDGAAMLIAGTLLLLGGTAFRWYAIRVLGRFFTRDVAIRMDHRIVRDGPYRYLRHPSYTGWLIFVLGTGIALDNWLSLTVIAVINFAVFRYRMNVEEAALAEAFGEAYRAYQQETKRVLPLIY